MLNFDMAFTIACSIYKGGEGKTTLAAHVVYAGQARGLRVLAVDIDKQGNLFKWLTRGDGVPRDGVLTEVSPTLTVLFAPGAVPVLPTGFDLVVIDVPPEGAAVTADRWLVPVSCRMALDGAASTCAEANGDVLLVLNKFNVGGIGTTAALRGAVQRINATGLLTVMEIPESAAILRAGELFIPAWEGPYGKDTPGVKALRAVLDRALTGVAPSRKTGPERSTAKRPMEIPPPGPIPVHRPPTASGTGRSR